MRMYNCVIDDGENIFEKLFRQETGKNLRKRLKETEI